MAPKSVSHNTGRVGGVGNLALSSVNFALFGASDAYSTDRKIMGRQSAGKALIRGVARRWPAQPVHVFGYQKSAGQAIAAQLMAEGHTGSVHWRPGHGDETLDALGAVYYPAPISLDIARARNLRGPARYSLFGVTHTLSSTGAMDDVAALVMPPFKPWDALICTSNAALGVVTRLQDEMRELMARETGATRFNPIQLPVIPLGVDAPAFESTPDQAQAARQALGLAPDEVAFLFAGRLTFHAKANPAALYQGLEQAAARTKQPLVCIEAGLYPNSGVADVFAQARAALAPSVRFIEVRGDDDLRYRQAWRAADVFVSLSDNIQETYGLTPVEAMAAGHPVLVSDWNGYKDTVRDGVDGYRIPVTLPMAGAGESLAMRHATDVETYDFYIGRASMSTVIDIGVLADRIVSLAESPELRARLGQSGARRARELYDWPVILDRYVELTNQLGEIRRSAGDLPSEAWVSRPDPFSLFGDYPTATLSNDWIAAARADEAAVQKFLSLGLADYVLKAPVLTPDMILGVHRAITRAGSLRVGDLLTGTGLALEEAVQALMWLAKFDLVELRP